MIDIQGYKFNATIYENVQTIVYRGFRIHDSLPIIAKLHNTEYPSQLELASYRREYKIGNSIHSDNIAKYYELINYKNNLCIIMEDFGGLSLSEMIPASGMEIREFLNVAIQIVESIAIIHKNNIIHKDIKPQNILFNKETNKIKIIDFSISSQLSEEKSNFKSVRQLEGTLEYISPEQTGRINRNVDHRSDLYSLGITFYQMLTGVLPYRATDDMETIYNHIARIPKAPHLVKTDIPEVISHIVIKLLEKSAEERYKSIFGLMSDLKKIEAVYKTTNQIPIINIGENDFSDKFIIPQKLYGREKELDVLNKTLTRICAPGSKSAKEIILISGISGIGKTAFVNEIQKPATEKNAIFIIGKFEKEKQNIPLYSLVLAFKSLIAQIILESDTEIQKWKTDILASVGSNGQVLIDVIPEIKLIIGEQPPVEVLPLSETQNRFDFTFSNFIKVFSNSKQALILYLDDLQWADLTSLKFIEKIMSNSEIHSLLLIGSYRSNEVDLAHPLLKIIENLKNILKIQELFLEALELKDISKMILDIFNLPIEKANSLANIILSRTSGNPFFINQFITTLYEEKLIYFKYENQQWELNEKEIMLRSISSNVVDLLIEKINKLEPDCIEILKLATCIGNQFNLQNLSQITKKSKYLIAKFLWTLIKDGFVIPLDDSYKFISEENEDFNIRYKFSHDKILQAAYSLIGEMDKKKNHIMIGRILLQENYNDDSIYDIVNHLNIGRDLIENEKEIDELVKLNYIAGKKAKNSNAYREALQFFSIAISFLKNDSFTQNYNFTLSLYTELSSCHYLVGEFEQGEKLFTIIESNIKTVDDKSDFYYTKLQLYYSMFQIKNAVEIGKRGLKNYSINISSSPTILSLLPEIIKINFKTFHKEISKLIDLPIVTDKERIKKDKFITMFIQPAYISGNELLHVILECKIVNLSLSSGYTEHSSLSFASFGVVLSAAFGDANSGYEYGKLALELCNKFENKEYKPRVLFLFACLIVPWKKHLKETIPMTREAYELSLEMGDWLYASYSGNRLVAQRLAKGDNLPGIAAEAIKYSKFIERTKNQNLIDTIYLWLSISLNLQGLTNDKYSWDNENFNEKTVLERMNASGYSAGICFYYLYKAQMYYLYEEFSLAYQMIIEVEKREKALMGLTDYAEVPFYYSLIVSNLYNSNPRFSKRKVLRILKKKNKKLKAWAKHCPENFLHKCLLISAEIERISGNEVNAIKLYHQSIKLSSDNDFLHHVAIANELAGKYYLSLGLNEISKVCISESYYYYKRWGANIKASELEDKYKIKTIKPVDSQTISATKRTSFSDKTSSQNLNIDMISIMKSSNILTSEISLPKLLNSLMKITIENAGAEKGFLILLNKGEMTIEAKFNSGDEIADTISQKLDSNELACAIVNYVRLKRETVVIDDSTKEERFARDQYIASKKPKSILCMPLLNKNNLTGILYLENNLITYAFTVEKIEVLKLLSAQASIAIENAKLYFNINKLNNVYEKFVPRQFLEFLGKNDITEIKLGDQVQKEMTILFSDIRSFTTLSETMTPEENFNFLNSYLKRIGPIIRNNNGYIDKYIGDAIMALFAREPEDGVSASIDMQKEIREYNKFRLKQNYKPISVGIGLHTGILMLGTIGELERMEGTVISDSVNLASRVEGLTKIYNASIIITDNLFQKIKNTDKYYYRVLDTVKVKGKNESIQIIEILNGQADYKIELFMNTKNDFEMAINAYQFKEFKAAKSLFENVLENNHADIAAKLYLKRTEYYLEHGVPIDWDGVEIMGSK